MQVNCLKEELFKGVQLVQNAISPRSTLPVLANILLESGDGGGLRLSSTDLEVGIRCMVKADVRTGGATTVPARTLGDFLRTLEDGRELDIKVEEGQKMEIRAGRDRARRWGRAFRTEPRAATALAWRNLQDWLKAFLGLVPEPAVERRNARRLVRGRRVAEIGD